MRVLHKFDNLISILYILENAFDSVFYLKPKKKWSPGDDIRLESTPTGHKNTRLKICRETGLVGFFTNDLGRSTAITLMCNARLAERTAK